MITNASPAMPYPHEAPDWTLPLLAISGFCMVMLIQVVVCVLLYLCFTRLAPEHRKLAPGLVWLLLIPVFNLVWNFFVVLRLAESYQSQFRAIGREDVGDAGWGIGLAYAICAAGSIVPCLNVLAAPAALVLLIIYLVKVMSLRGQLPEPAAA